MYKVRHDELHYYWPVVRAGLLKVIENGQCDWIPENIYGAVRTGNALLYMVNKDSFVVLNVIEAYDGGKELHIWCAYGSGRGNDQYMPEVDAVAKELGCHVVTFFSPRRGWAKNKIGFEEVHTLYRKRI